MRLKDVADNAGVSMATASRILKDDESFSVSPDTIKRVKNCASNLGYIRKVQKKNLNQSASFKSLGIVVTKTRAQDEDNYFTNIIRGIEKEAIANHFKIAFNYAASDFSKTGPMETVLNSKADGLILIGFIPPSLFTNLSRSFRNVISVFEIPENCTTVDCVTVEYELPFYMLTKKLISCGRKNIAFIGGDTYKTPVEGEEMSLFQSRDERFQGYLKGLIDSGIQIRRDLIHDGHWNIDIAYEKMKQILDSKIPVDAVEAASDKMAFGAMKAIRERGLSIPEDVSVIGFDNIDMASYSSPSLTTVSFDRDELGREAFFCLLNLVNDKRKAIGRKTILPTYIIERDSICSF